MENRITLEAITGSFSSIMSWFFWLIVLFFAAMVFDYTTGTLAARRRGEWCSTRAREGLYHKLGTTGALILAVMIDIVIGLAANTVIKLPFDFPGLFSPLCAVWYIVTEFGSVVENLTKLGANIPDFMKKGLAAIHSAAERTAEQTENALHSNKPDDKKGDDDDARTSNDAHDN